MSMMNTQNLLNTKSGPEPSTTRGSGLLKRAARGAVVAGTIAALSLTAVPITAHAGGPGVGAAIGLGVLGGVLAGAAITSTAPVYAAPSPYSYYSDGSYGTAPAYYSAPQTYYPAPYTYPQPYYSYYSR